MTALVTQPTSKLVPPTSVVITFGKPSACPSAAAPTTPPAGPDATSLIACPFAFAVEVTPPEDCITSGAGNPALRRRSASRSR